MKNIFKLLRKDVISSPPWDYDFLYNLPEREYSIYLEKVFKLNTGDTLPLEYDFKNKLWIINKSRCKTFNQKIQYLKLYDATPLKRDCTDKVKVRDFVGERIGAEYLKPVLQICNNFDEINFVKLPKSFVLKCNHGCKWQYIIKDKQEFLDTKSLFELVKKNITGWLEQEYWVWSGFEMQYHNIESKILIEPLMRDYIDKEPEKINIYCFNGEPKIFIRFFDKNTMSIWNSKFKHIDNIFNFSEGNIKTDVDDYINQTFELVKKLAKSFNFVRIDWMIYQNKLYFEELTFTPYSGFLNFKDYKAEIDLGRLLDIGEGN